MYYILIDMKDLFTGLLLGFAVGVCSYFLVDGYQNQQARLAAANQQKQYQAEVNLLAKVCPEVMQNKQTK